MFLRTKPQENPAQPTVAPPTPQQLPQFPQQQNIGIDLHGEIAYMAAKLDTLEENQKIIYQNQHAQIESLKVLLYELKDMIYKTATK